MVIEYIIVYYCGNCEWYWYVCFNGKWDSDWDQDFICVLVGVSGE